MSRLQYDQNGFAIESGFELCYCCDSLTGEYIGLFEQYVSVNCGLPAHAYLDPPPEHEAGEWPVRKDREEPWYVVTDLRGQTAYRIDNKLSRVITQCGPLHDGETTLKPSSPYDAWDGFKWVTDREAESAAELAAATAKRSDLLAEANFHISVLSDAVDLGMATEDEQAAYNAWRRYRVELTRLDLTVTPIAWPEKPQ